jgi:hypothetical protein
MAINLALLAILLLIAAGTFRGGLWQGLILFLNVVVAATIAYHRSRMARGGHGMECPSRHGRPAGSGSCSAARPRPIRPTTGP